jgi:leader peptidase (prepilin peptidase)/N-methyltransferase
MMWLGILTFPQLESAGFGFFWVVMGLFVGSFLNVCIHRFPVEGASVWSPARSHCPGCDRQLEWRENLPVLSWLLQRGRCLGCAAPIHWRYPLVELIGAAAFYLSWRAAASLGWGFLLLDSIVLAALVVATFVDFERYEIPDQVSIGGMWAAPVVSFVMPGLHSSGLVAVALAAGEAVDGVASVSECFAGMALGGGVLYGLGWIGKRVSGADAMGFGDVKLMAAGGGLVGVVGTFQALQVAVFAGSLVGVLNILRWYLVVRARQRRRRLPNRGRPQALRTARVLGRYLPFGPYLALGIGIVLLDWKDVLNLLPFGLG